MAKQRSEASRWISRYGEIGETLYVSDSQYLAETMMTRQAQKDGIVLPPRFWRNKEWSKRFILQSKQASELLQTFSCEVILEALRHWRLKNCFSLGLKSVIEPICQEIAERRGNLATMQQQQLEAAPEPEQRENVPLYRAPSGGGGIRNKLRD